MEANPGSVPEAPKRPEAQDELDKLDDMLDRGGEVIPARREQIDEATSDTAFQLTESEGPAKMRFFEKIRSRRADERAEIAEDMEQHAHDRFTAAQTNQENVAGRIETRSTERGEHAHERDVAIMEARAEALKQQAERAANAEKSGINAAYEQEVANINEAIEAERQEAANEKIAAEEAAAARQEFNAQQEALAQQEQDLIAEVAKLDGDWSEEQNRFAGIPQLKERLGRAHSRDMQRLLGRQLAGLNRDQKDGQKGYDAEKTALDQEMASLKEQQQQVQAELDRLNREQAARDDHAAGREERIQQRKNDITTKQTERDGKLAEVDTQSTESEQARQNALEDYRQNGAEAVGAAVLGNAKISFWSRLRGGQLAGILKDKMGAGIDAARAFKAQDRLDIAARELRQTFDAKQTAQESRINVQQPIDERLAREKFDREIAQVSAEIAADQAAEAADQRDRAADEARKTELTSRREELNETINSYNSDQQLSDGDRKAQEADFKTRIDDLQQKIDASHSDSRRLRLQSQLADVTREQKTTMSAYDKETKQIAKELKPFSDELARIEGELDNIDDAETARTAAAADRRDAAAGRRTVEQIETERDQALSDIADRYDAQRADLVKQRTDLDQLLGDVASDEAEPEAATGETGTEFGSGTGANYAKIEQSEKMAQWLDAMRNDGAFGSYDDAQRLQLIAAATDSLHQVGLVLTDPNGQIRFGDLNEQGLQILRQQSAANSSL